MARSPSGSSRSPLIIDLSPRVVDDFCRCVDSLNDWEWMRFASHVMNDQTTIQRFYVRRKSGDYVTRELLWSWGQKLATVQDLEVILQKLELYRALEILLQGPCSLETSPVIDERRGALQASDITERNSRNCNDVTEKVSEIKAQSFPSPPQPPSELLRSLLIDSYSGQVSSTDQAPLTPREKLPSPALYTSVSKPVCLQLLQNYNSQHACLVLQQLEAPCFETTNARWALDFVDRNKEANDIFRSAPDPHRIFHCVLSIPQQEISLSLNTTCQPWTKQQLEEATDRFSVDRKIHSGQFADVFIGRKGDNVYAIKRLKEVPEPADRTDVFYEKEAQIGFRCHHPNLLKLLGFCVETKHYYLVHQFMKNGSLDVALQKVGSCVLSWERRLAISAGLLQVVDHLHKAGIFHGNIKSSNIFLDEDLAAKLGHAGARFCPDRSASYTNVKTYELQRFQPYLPDSYLRSGQLTAQTDIFSCGVVLAELLTGLKPTDKDRDPTYLKDLILTEVEQVKVKTESDRMGSVDLLCAKEIGQKYRDKRLEPLGISSAIHWASAICLCLAKKRTLLAEVIGVMEKAQESFRSLDKESQGEMSSLNIPEESDESLSISYDQGDALEMPSSSNKGATYSPPLNEVYKRSPCELDESGSYNFYPGNSWYWTKPSSQSTPSSAGHQANSCTPIRNFPQKVSNSPTESNEPSWGIEVNEAKLKLMEEIELYAEEKVDSSVLFESA